MPCYDSRDDDLREDLNAVFRKHGFLPKYDDSLKKNADKMTDYLCRVLSLAEEKGLFQQLHLNLSAPDILQWWVLHKQWDKERSR